VPIGAAALFLTVPAWAMHSSPSTVVRVRTHGYTCKYWSNIDDSVMLVVDGYGNDIWMCDGIAHALRWNGYNGPRNIRRWYVTCSFTSPHDIRARIVVRHRSLGREYCADLKWAMP
jgi:hypothetical protein